MKEIEKILIENFQSHIRSEIFFDRFAVIVGPTDSGKSAIIRALTWNLYNVPDGDDFIRTGTKTAKVTVYFTDGTYIVRSKGGQNYYEIFDGTSTIKMESFGRGPVDPVVNFHGMRDVPFFGRLNVCTQFEGPFLLSKSPGELAKSIGAIAGVAPVDAAIKSVNSDIRDLKKDTKIYKENLKSVKESLKEFKFLPAMKKDIEKLEKIEKNSEDLKDKAKHLRDIHFRILTMRATQAKQESILEMLPQIESVASMIGEAANVLKLTQDLRKNIAEKNRQERIACMLDSISAALKVADKVIGDIQIANKVVEIQNRIKSKEHEIKKSERLVPQSENIQKGIEMLESCDTRLYTRLSDLRSKISRINLEKSTNMQMIEASQKTYEEKLSEYKDALDELKVCPTCGQGTQDISIDNMV